MDNLAQVQAVDYIPEYRGAPIEEMSDYLDRQELKYTTNKSKRDQLEVQLENEKVLDKGNEIKQQAIKKMEEQLKQVTERGDYENATRMVDDAIKTYSTDKLLNQEKADLVKFNDYKTKLDEMQKEGKLHKDDYNQVMQLVQLGMKPASLDEFGEATSGINTIEPAAYKSVNDVVDTKIKDMAVHKYGKNTTISKVENGYIIKNNEGKTVESISEDRVKTLTKLAIEGDQELQSYLNFKTQLDYNTKKISKTLPTLENLKGVQEFEDFILLEGVKELSSEDQVYLYNMSKTKQNLINNGLQYARVKYAYTNVDEFAHETMTGDPNFDAKERKRKEEEAKNNYSITGTAIDNTLSHNQVREENIRTKNELLDIETKLALQEKALDIKLKLQEVATFDEEGNVISVKDPVEYDRLLEEQENLLNNNNFTLMDENKVNTLRSQQKKLKRSQQYYQNRIRENQIAYAQSVEGEEYIDGVNGVFRTIGNALGASVKLDPEDVKSLITGQDLDYIEQISNIAAQSGEGFSSKAGQDLLHGWLTGTVLGRKMAKELLKEASNNPNLSTKGGDKVMNLVKAFEEAKGILKLTESARGLVSTINDNINEFTINNPTATTTNLTVGTGGSGAEIADKNTLEIVKKHAGSFTVLEGGMTLEATINQQAKEAWEELDDDEAEPLGYEIISASTIINGDYAGATQIEYKIGEKKYNTLIQDAEFGEDMVIDKSVAVLKDAIKNNEEGQRMIETYNSSPSLLNALEVASFVTPSNDTKNAIDGLNATFNPSINRKLLTNLNNKNVGGYSETEPLDVNIVVRSENNKEIMNNIQAKVYKKVSQGRSGYTYGIKIYDVTKESYVDLTTRSKNSETEEEEFKTLEFATLQELQHSLMTGIDL